MFDQFLGAQGLARSTDKTFHYKSRPEAIAALRDDRLASLGGYLDSDDERAIGELHASFDRDVVEEHEVSRSRFRYIVRALGNRRDDHGVATLSANARLANI